MKKFLISLAIISMASSFANSCCMQRKATYTRRRSNKAQKRNKTCFRKIWVEIKKTYREHAEKMCPKTNRGTRIVWFMR